MERETAGSLVNMKTIYNTVEIITPSSKNKCNNFFLLYIFNVVGERLGDGGCLVK